MSSTSKIIAGTVAALAIGAGAYYSYSLKQNAPKDNEHFHYPPTKRTDFSENLHGVAVPDPYRWFEKPNFVLVLHEISQKFFFNVMNFFFGCEGWKILNRRKRKIGFNRNQTLQKAF